MKWYANASVAIEIEVDLPESADHDLTSNMIELQLQRALPELPAPFRWMEGSFQLEECHPVES